MPICTMDVMQHSHVISYGICSKEDVIAHAHILRCTKQGVEAIVRERARREIRKRLRCHPC